MFTLEYYSVMIDSSFSESKQIHPSYILRERWDVLSWPSVFAPGSESKRNMFVNHLQMTVQIRIEVHRTAYLQPGCSTMAWHG